MRITSFRLASTRRRRDRAGQWADGETTWLNVTCWRNLAVNVADSVAKRDRVVVHGRLRVRKYNASDGAERLSVEVEADSVGHDLAYGTSVYTRVRRSEPIEPGRAEADELVRQVELEAMAQDLDLLTGSADDDLDDDTGEPGGLAAGQLVGAAG